MTGTRHARIDRDEAVRRAGTTAQTTSGQRNLAILERSACRGTDELQRHPDDLPTEPAWYVLLPWFDGLDGRSLRSSRLITIVKSDGRVIYDGSAQDEGREAGVLACDGMLSVPAHLIACPRRSCSRDVQSRPQGTTGGARPKPGVLRQRSWSGFGKQRGTGATRPLVGVLLDKPTENGGSRPEPSADSNPSRPLS